MLSAIARGIDDFTGPTASEATLTLIHWGRRNGNGEPIYEEPWEKLLKDQLPALSEAFTATAEIQKPIVEWFKPNVPPFCGLSAPGIVVLAERRTRLQPSHTDFDILTMWLGATKPGFRVFDEGKQDWLSFDKLPAGHALIWRGDLAYTDDNVQLKPTPHYVGYRQVVRRVVMLA
jgi:hypothetical protein